MSDLVKTLRKCGMAVYLACDEVVARDISTHLNAAADEIESLRRKLELAKGNTIEDRSDLIGAPKNVRRIVNDWIRDIVPLAGKMNLLPQHINKLIEALQKDSVPHAPGHGGIGGEPASLPFVVALANWIQNDLGGALQITISDEDATHFAEDLKRKVFV